MNTVPDATDQLTLARLDYELHAGAWPLDVQVTVDYITTVYPDRTIDRILLADVLTDYIGCFPDPADLARTLTAQTYVGDETVNLRAWPFCHIDWDAAAVGLESAIVEGRPGPIVRVAGHHYFASDHQV